MTTAFRDTADAIASVVEDRLPDTGLTRSGRREAHRRLAEQGVHPDEIAALLGIAVRTVYRWQAEQRTTPATPCPGGGQPADA